MFPLILLYLILTIVRPQDYMPALVGVPVFPVVLVLAFASLAGVQRQDLCGTAVRDTADLSGRADDFDGGQRLAWRRARPVAEVRSRGDCLLRVCRRLHATRAVS